MSEVDISAKKESSHWGFLNIVKTALDIAGLVPGLNVVAGLASGAISLAQGHYVEAGVGVLAAVPIFGVAVRGVKIAKAARGFTKFFHGTTIESAESIVSDGLKAVSTRTGNYTKGSFFAHEASDEGLTAASHWPVVSGKATSEEVRVVEMTVPNDVLKQLEKQGLIRTGTPVGTRFPNETVFSPEALGALNESASFRVVPPSF